MTLIEQFPDFSLELRNKRARHRKSHPKPHVMSIEVKNINEAEARHYDNAFRKRHYQVLLIISLLVAALYIFIFNLPLLFR